MPCLPRYEVALEDKANAIYSLLQNESIVALVGMGGIGKTTLSKKIYHLFHNQYEKSSFLENVKSKDINDVKKKLLQDLCDRKLHKDEDVDEHFDDVKQCMISKNVLVVVDDVDMTKNLQDLQLFIDKDATNVDCKSKILVNCRNWQILKNHVRQSAKVDMELLEEEKARELFMLHAFKHANCVTNDLKIIYMDIIKACGGLPLSLEVLGCYLCDIHDLEIWKGALHELKGGRNITGSFDNEMLWKTLRISYDHLIKTHQDMFLDIACFFVGFKKSTFCRVYWNGNDSSSFMLILQNLEDRSLIKWAEDGSLYMHEQLQDMGRNIETEVTMSRFIWKPNISLQNNQVVENLKGISFKKCEVLPSFFQNGSKEFHNLRLLDLTKASPNTVENFIQGQDLNNL
jgi:energy-coupling factor transporter ATP-binding protein EcfA2